MNALRSARPAGLVGICLSFLIFYCTPASAGSVTQPGSHAGLAVGAPLPEGTLLFIDTFSYGSRGSATGHVHVPVNIPVLVWSTPWTVLDGRLQLLLGQSANAVGVESPGRGRDWKGGLYNTFLGAMTAWDLGSGYGFSYLLGGYLPSRTDTAFASPSIYNGVALSYSDGLWNANATLQYGVMLDDNVRRSHGAVAANADHVNLDLSVSRKIGKWEVGLVGFASGDVNRPNAAYRKVSQVAAGGLLGYDFGAFTVQTMLTRDISEANYGGRETRGWVRLILPLVHGGL